MEGERRERWRENGEIEGQEMRHLEHGTAGLTPLIPPEFLRQVPRRRGGDEVADSLGHGVSCSSHHYLSPTWSL